MVDGLKSFAESETAATATEYAVMLALILLALIASVATFGHKVNNMYSQINNVWLSHV